jgi:hypothetical protein
MTYADVLECALQYAEEFACLAPKKRAEQIDAHVAKEFPDAPDAWISQAVDEANEALDI